MSQNDHDQLRSIDRRSASAQLFYEYNSGGRRSEYFKGAETEYKHFLPRMVELCLNGEEIHFTPELYFNRFIQLKQKHWSKNEIALLEEFSQHIIMSSKQASDLTANYIMLSNFPVNLENLLDIWVEELLPSKLKEIKVLLEEEYDWQGDKLINGFSTKVTDELFHKWLHKPSIIEKLKHTIEALIVEDQWDEVFDVLYDYVIELEKRTNP